jgi:hypothetical protein
MSFRYLSKLRNSVVSVAEYGADPTGTTNSTAAFTAALADADEVFVPEGTYLANISLAGMTGKTLRGAGRYSTFVKNFSAGAVITLDNTDDPCQVIKIADMALVNRDEATYTTTDGILITGGDANQQEFCLFQNLWIQNFRHGINIDARLIWSSFENVHSLSNVNGLYCEPAGNVSQLAFRNCRFGNNTQYGVRAIKDADDAMSGWHFDTCTFELNGLNGVRVSGTASGLAGWTFTGAYTEFNATDIAASATSPRKANFYFDADVVLGLNFSGGALYGGAGNNPDWNIYVDSPNANGFIGPNRVGTMTIGFATVPAGFAVAHQDGGTTSVTKGVGSISFPSLIEQESTTFTATLTGCDTSPTGTVRAVKQGTLVTLYLPLITGTSNSTAATLTGLSTSLYPARDQSILCRVSNGGSGIVLGLLEIDPAGLITLRGDVGGGVFLGSGTKGVQIQTLTYSVE